MPIERVKYPRTPHLPWSSGRSSDDKVLPNVDHFVGQEVVVTEKMDGENTTLYADGYIHARSTTSSGHPSRDWLHDWWRNRSIHLPYGARVCGENLYAKHSIYYAGIGHPFRGFSIWDYSCCLRWDTTIHMFGQSLIIVPVNVLWRGVFDEKALKKLASTVDRQAETVEGYVVRLANAFDINDFGRCVAKYVRKNHVTTDQHWTKNWTKNGFIINGL